MIEDSQMNIVDKIVMSKRAEIEELKARSDQSELRKQAMDTSDCRGLVTALKNCPHVPIIAEIKRLSPSEGMLGAVQDVVDLAQTYETAGAAAISVLTDFPFFGGDLDDLTKAREAVKLPILRKDFILDPIQLYQSRLAGADVVLLIASILDFAQLDELFQEAIALGMTPLVEVHNREELEEALRLRAPVVGINNRNLATLKVDLNTCATLAPIVSNGTLVVAESGIKGPSDVTLLRNSGAHAFLIGTTLMRSPDPEAALRELCQARNGT
jgi:indole-3-glycerol phosphate synthase